MCALGNVWIEWAYFSPYLSADVPSKPPNMYMWSSNTIDAKCLVPQFMSGSFCSFFVSKSIIVTYFEKNVSSTHFTIGNSLLLTDFCAIPSIDPAKTYALPRWAITSKPIRFPTSNSAYLSKFVDRLLYLSVLIDDDGAPFFPSSCFSRRCRNIWEEDQMNVAFPVRRSRDEYSWFLQMSPPIVDHSESENRWLNEDQNKKTKSNVKDRTWLVIRSTRTFGNSLPMYFVLFVVSTPFWWTFVQKLFSGIKGFAMAGISHHSMLEC